MATTTPTTTTATTTVVTITTVDRYGQMTCYLSLVVNQYMYYIYIWCQSSVSS